MFFSFSKDIKCFWLSLRHFEIFNSKLEQCWIEVILKSFVIFKNVCIYKNGFHLYLLKNVWNFFRTVLNLIRFSLFHYFLEVMIEIGFKLKVQISLEIRFFSRLTRFPHPLYLPNSIIARGDWGTCLKSSDFFGFCFDRLTTVARIGLIFGWGRNGISKK